MSEFWEGFAVGASTIAALGMLLFWMIRVAIPYAIDRVINRFE